MPYRISGNLKIDVEVGDVHEDNISGLNFGSLSTEIGIIGIDLTDEVIRSAGLQRDDLFRNLRVEVTLVESDYGDPQSGLNSYLIKTLEVLQ